MNPFCKSAFCSECGFGLVSDFSLAHDEGNVVVVEADLLGGLDHFIYVSGLFLTKIDLCFAALLYGLR